MAFDFVFVLWDLGTVLPEVRLAIVVDVDFDLDFDFDFDFDFDIDFAVDLEFKLRLELGFDEAELSTMVESISESAAEEEFDR